MIHSSPADTRLLLKEIERLSRDFTVFAFDTPGFGLSDPLPLASMTVADLADAMAETMVAAGLPRCPVFGTHTGASIALELGVRHPRRVTGLILDGLAAFKPEECAAWFGDYFRKFPVSDLGGHYTDIWTRFRDQSIWFPWTARDPTALNENDLSPPHSTHLWMQMYFEAADHYEHAYRAAIFHGEAAISAGLNALALPALICATTTDMLYPHLQRLPPLRARQSIVDIGASYERKRELIARGFAQFGAEGLPPASDPVIHSWRGIERQFVDGSAGSLHLRFSGDRDAPPLLLLHDAPGSSEQAEPLIKQLSATNFVIAPDLPGNGESDPFMNTPDIQAYASEALLLLDHLRIQRASLHGLGFGSSVALAIAARAPERVEAVTLRDPIFPDATTRAEMYDRHAPPIEIEPHGGHWYRTWLMLRDSEIYFPWFKTQRSSLRRTPADISADRLHAWTVDVMRARETYGDLIRAALSWDAESALSSLQNPVSVISRLESHR